VNLSWLPRWHVWANSVISINPKWPPDAILKIHDVKKLTSNMV